MDRELAKADGGFCLTSDWMEPSENSTASCTCSFVVVVVVGWLLPAISRHGSLSLSLSVTEELGSRPSTSPGSICIVHARVQSGLQSSTPYSVHVCTTYNTSSM